MKKVLFVATITRHINTFHIPYLKWFKEQGYEVHVASNGDEKIEYCDKHYDLPFERFPLKKNNLKTYRKLKKIINDNEYEIIHCHTPVGGVLTRLAARTARKKSNTKVIYTAHGFHFYKGAPLINWIIYYPIEKICARWTDCLITINPEDYNLAKKKFKARQTELVHGVGVDETKFNFNMTVEEKNQFREKLGVEKNDFIIVIIGELNKNKNQIMAINAMKELVQKSEDIKLLLVGKGILEEEYHNKIKEYNLENKILMLGYRTDIPKILKISDLLLSLSYREGLPVNVIEAKMCGLPIIATNCRGNRDLVKNCIKINDLIQLKKKIIENYNKTDITKNEEKLNNDIEKYKNDNVINQMKKIYWRIKDEN